MENEINNEENIETEVPPISKSKWEPSIIIALVAVLISSASAFISLYEARMMKKQQQIILEQKEASVWPYIQIYRFQNFEIDDTKGNEKDKVTYDITIKNKGIGPAIIGDAIFLLDGDTISSGDIPFTLDEKHEDYKISYVGNAGLSNSVLAPNEEYSVLSFRIDSVYHRIGKVNDFLTELDIDIRFCYCSVYDKCWKVQDGNILKNNECAPREEIR